MAGAYSRAYSTAYSTAVAGGGLNPRDTTLGLSVERPVLTVHSSIEVSDVACVVDVPQTLAGLHLYGAFSHDFSYDFERGPPTPVENAILAVSVEPPVLTPHYSVSVSPVALRTAYDRARLSKALAPSDLTVVTDAPSPGIYWAVGVNAAASGVDVEKPIATAHALSAPLDVACALSVEQPIVTGHDRPNLVPFDIGLVVAAELPEPISHPLVVPNDIAFAIIADPISRSAHAPPLELGDTNVALVAEAPEVTASSVIAPLDCSLAVAADLPVAVQLGVLVSEVVSVVFVEQPIPSVHDVVAVADVAVVLEATEPARSEWTPPLATVDTNVALVADAPDVTGHAFVAPNDITVYLTSDGPILSKPGEAGADVQDVTTVVSSELINLTAHLSVEVYDVALAVEATQPARAETTPPLAPIDHAAVLSVEAPEATSHLFWALAVLDVSIAVAADSPDATSSYGFTYPLDTVAALTVEPVSLVWHAAVEVADVVISTTADAPARAEHSSPLAFSDIALVLSVEAPEATSHAVANVADVSLAVTATAVGQRLEALLPIDLTVGVEASPIARAAYPPPPAVVGPFDLIAATQADAPDAVSHAVIAPIDVAAVVEAGSPLAVIGALSVNPSDLGLVLAVEAPLAQGAPASIQPINIDVILRNPGIVIAQSGRLVIKPFHERQPPLPAYPRGRDEIRPS